MNAKRVSFLDKKDTLNHFYFFFFSCIVGNSILPKKHYLRETKFTPITSNTIKLLVIVYDLAKIRL